MVIRPLQYFAQDMPAQLLWHVPNFAAITLLNSVLQQNVFALNCEKDIIGEMGPRPDAAIWFSLLTHWGRVTHVRVGNLTIIGADNGLSPGRRQAIIWINAGIMLIGPLGTNLSEILIEIHVF